MIALVATLLLTWFAPSDRNDVALPSAKGEKNAQISTSQVKIEAPVADQDAKGAGNNGVLIVGDRETVGSADSGILFEPHSWFVAPPPPPPAPIMPTPPPPAPTAPPLPFTYLGKYIEDNVQWLILSQGNRVHTVRQGDTIDNQYKIDRIDTANATLLYLPLGIHQTIVTGSF
jgi:hypothetical protein